MSTAHVALSSQPAVVRPGEEKDTRHLAPVESVARRRRPRVGYALTAVIGALLIAIVQMVLSIGTTQASFQVSQLTQEQRDITYQQQELNDAISGLTSPQYLAANASSLGMVVGAAPTYLRLSDGAIIGAGEAATTSTVDAAARPNVANALVADTPLVTDPDATIDGTNQNSAPETDTATGLPPALTDGLPTPSTH